MKTKNKKRTCPRCRYQGAYIPEIGSCNQCGYVFDDTIEWKKNNPGNTEFYCEHCGIYKASKPHCNKCESVPEITKRELNK